MKTRLLCTIFLLLMTTVHALGADRFAVADVAVPVFSSPAIGTTPEKRVRLDACGQPRSLEFIALPGTAFTIEEELQVKTDPVYRITTADYPASFLRKCYVGGKALRTVETKPAERQKKLPDTAAIVKRLASAVGAPYLWGSNTRHGFSLFVSGSEEAVRLTGIDCSGLLYEATDGYTPRNTAELAAFGRGVPIAGFPLDQIIERIRPLDLIVWRRHVVIVLDEKSAIESRLVCGKPGNGGVKISPLRDRLRSLLKRKKAADSAGGTDTFVVRRWLPEE